MIKKVLLRFFSRFLGFNKGYILSKCIINKGAKVAGCSFKISGENNRIIFATGARVENSIFYIFGNNNTIVIGENSRFLGSKFWIEKDGNSIQIGENNKSSGSVIFATLEGTSIIVGNNNLFAYNIELRTSDAHSIYQFDHRINPAKNIVIGNCNWIAKNVVFLKGSSIQNNCVIGYNSLLTKNFRLNHVLIVGQPGKIIKENIEWKYEI